MNAFVLTMRYAGLRIGDTLALTRERLSTNANTPVEDLTL
jgi:hypothetical protein